MFPAIENPSKLELPPEIEQVLTTMFATYRRIIIRKEFGGGFSGGRVLEIQPITANGTPELPVVVKLAMTSLIQKEWQAYRQHIHRRLPYVAEIRAEPMVLPEIGWGGLRYTLMGGNTFEVVSLSDYCHRADTTVENMAQAFTRLLKIMRQLWRYDYIDSNFCLRPSYNHLLPVHFLVEGQPARSTEQAVLITPENDSVPTLNVGDRVCVSGFALSKANPITGTMTLTYPQARSNPFAFYVRCKTQPFETVAAYQINQIIETFEGEIIETRAGRLQAELRRIFGDSVDPTGPMVSLPAAGEVVLPNPLRALETLLNSTCDIRVASVHGDFNLENILIEPETGLISLIDFADAREDHVLHDLLRLETEVMTKLVPEILLRHDLPPVSTLAGLYWHLHRLNFEVERVQPTLLHPDLKKAWTLLSLIRQTVREYLLEPDDITEYYRGLILYLVGALKFKNLNHVPEHPLPKQVAFWGATLAYQFLTNPSDNSDTPPPDLASLIEAQPQAPPALDKTEITPSPTAALTQADAERKLAALPLTTIPNLAPLPSGSRMPLSRNPLFVGRQPDLIVLARALKGGETIAIGQVETAATTGLGGMGKTQLASEFVHRYGQYFAGGVFWLSFADPKAIPAEIAACGGPGALDLRRNFGDRPLEEQIRLVLAAWQEPTPRLLVFDNCENPDLLTRWRPSTGSCRILITSRRADWAPTLGVQALPLDVLNRAESIALLREHQPDADDAILDAIAAEVGDLPLALHLAGSYMARYRRVITPAQYLEQLRDPQLLQHRSLQGIGLSPTRHVQNVYRTIALSYDQLTPDNSVDR
jgi:hypothetical protein